MTLPYLAIYYVSSELSTARIGCTTRSEQCEHLFMVYFHFAAVENPDIHRQGSDSIWLATYILSADIGCITCGERREHRFMSYLN